jgi:maleylpyruvate isomerase
MYSSGTQRTGDIKTGSSLPPHELRSLVRRSARELAASFDSLTPAMWEHKVVTAQGRTVPASELVWMRFREVAVHAIDLDTGISFGDLPPEAVAKLVHEIVTKRLGSGEGPGLAAWLTGRKAAGPPLGPWL